MKDLKNVIDLSFFRAMRRAQSGRNLFMVTDRDSDLLQLIDPPWDMIPVFAPHYLENPRLRADIVLIDSQVHWIDPIALTNEISKVSPIVWLAPKCQKRQKAWIRQAYASGVSDIIYSPFARDELEETLSVLIRLQRLAKNTAAHR